MCLAIPAKIVSVDGTTAEADIGGLTRKISVWLTPDVKVGDYVLLHTGYAVNVINEEEAQETLKLLAELGENIEDEIAGNEIH